MALTTLKAKHLSIFWYQITATNMSHLIREKYVGHLKPTIENINEEKNLHPHKNPDVHTINSVTMEKMMSEQVEPDTFEPLCHKLKPNKVKCEALLKEYASQFA